MKQGWEVKKLNDVCSINYGTRVVQKKDGGSIYPVYGGGGATFKMDKYNREDCLIVSRFAMSPQCVRYVQGKFFLNDSGLSIDSMSSLLNQNFLDKHIIALNDKIYSLGKGAAQRNLDVNALKNIDIHYPMSLAEQEKIVAELDCLSGIIEKKKQQLKEYDALAQSIFYEMFGNPIDNEKGWELCTIDSLCSSIVRGPFGSALKKEYFIEPNPTAYKVYEQKHAIQKNADIGTYYISAERFATLSRFEVKAGDIIMSCSGTIGELFEIPISAEKGLMNQALLKFTLNHRIEKIYFLFAMECVKDSFERKGTGLQNIGSVGTIKKTQISLPEITLQQEFASKIEAIEKQKELIKQSIAETETLFNSRMDYYFN